MKRMSTALAALTAVTAVTTLATALAGCGGSSAKPDDATVTVAHAPSTLFAPLYLAQAKGYFAERGLKVDLQTIKAGQDAIPLAASGKVDAVVAGFSAGMFNALHAGLDIKIVGTMGVSTGDPKASPTALEVSKKLVDAGTVKAPADLRGRSVALSGGPGAAGGYQLGVTLAGSGLTLRDVRAVNLSFPDMEAAIANGSVDAALPPAPFTTRMERNGVAVPLAVPPAGTAASGVVYGAAFAGTDRAQKFFDALVRASADLQGTAAKSEQNLKILADATGEDLAVLQRVPFYTWRPDLAPDADQLTRQQRVYLDAGLLDFSEPLAPDKFVAPAFSQKAPR
ncbi:ABC transporter substrate-binding protein [Pseudonocardia acaciae]|uniref:ABC transporter substrate-binding protein n=1 Tax=Pseudonocardia acaciae TaxID=551276 RepID=UPI0004905681|nr:ABC transporter substrate-binding protein [Pseudonocardia acaciae]